MISSTLCYLFKDGRYLMLHRTKKEHDANRDKWIGIGGKFEEGESPEDCMRREVLEETGLSVTCFRYSGIVTFVSDRWEGEFMHLFLITDWTGTLRACDEGDLEWVAEEKMPQLPAWAGDKIFFSLMNRGGPFFSLKLTYAGEDLLSAELDGRPIDPTDY